MGSVCSTVLLPDGACVQVVYSMQSASST